MSSGPLLALETSTRAASVTLLVDGSASTARLDDARRHAVDLIPTIDALCARAGVRPTRLAVGLGPGSYTGLRVGIATVLGLARALPADAWGISSYDALAYEHVAPGQRATLLANAYGGRFYHARLERTADDVQTLVAPSVLSREELDALLAAPTNDVLLIDATLDALLDDDRPRLVGRTPSAPSIAHLAALRAAHTAPTPLDALEPLYLQPFGTPRT